MLEEAVELLCVEVSCETQRVDVLDQDLLRIRLRGQDLHHLGDEVLKLHGPWIAGLLLAHKFGLDVGRHKLEHLYRAALELITKRERP